MSGELFHVLPLPELSLHNDTLQSTKHFFLCLIKESQESNFKIQTVDSLRIQCGYFTTQILRYATLMRETDKNRETSVYLVWFLNSTFWSVMSMGIEYHFHLSGLSY